MDFSLGPAETEWRDKVRAFMDEQVRPRVPDYAAQQREGDRWKVLPVVDELKAKAKAEGLWNLFMPPSHGAEPVDDGFEFDGPGLTNLQCRIERSGDNYVINGRKWWSSGAGDPRCKVAILMGKTDPGAELHKQQSMILVPLDAPGVEIVRHLSVFGYDDAPHGHMEIALRDVRVPASNMLLGEGRGFEIAQGRLGPGRIHHCMRTIGVAEEALAAMVKRLMSRTAFGKTIAEQGVWEERIADARIDIEMTRLLCLKAADTMDRAGNKAAQGEIAMIKVAAPLMTLKIIDDAIQAFGAAGVSDDVGLARAYAAIRTLRLADGPDELHRRAIARLEFKKHR